MRSVLLGWAVCIAFAHLDEPLVRAGEGSKASDRERRETAAGMREGATSAARAGDVKRATGLETLSKSVDRAHNITEADLAKVQKLSNEGKFDQARDIADRAGRTAGSTGTGAGKGSAPKGSGASDRGRTRM